MKLRSVLLFVVALVSCAAPKPTRSSEAPAAVHEQPAARRPDLPFPPGVTVESQCGSVDDLQDVELYDGSLGVSKQYVALNEPSTVQFQWLPEAIMKTKLPGHTMGNVAGVRWCSGTRISDRLVITAGHCFDVQNGQHGWVSPFANGADGLPVFANPRVLATLQQVNFRYQVNGVTGAIRTAQSYPIVSLVEHRLGGLDYAIVELGVGSDGKLPAEDRFKPVKPLTRNPNDLESVAILQHPNGEPKKVEAGTVSQTVGSDVQYKDVDTHPGSSGSGIREANGDLIGVHTDGGCGQNSGANHGVTTKSISAVSSVF